MENGRFGLCRLRIHIRKQIRMRILKTFSTAYRFSLESLGRPLLVRLLDEVAWFVDSTAQGHADL